MALPIPASTTAPSVVAGLPVVYRSAHSNADDSAKVTIRPGRRRARQEGPDAQNDNPRLRGLLLDMVI